MALAVATPAFAVSGPSEPASPTAATLSGRVSDLSGSVSDAARAPDPVLPAGATTDTYRREITINGEPQGEGVALVAGKALYVDRAMALAANLTCGRTIERDGRRLCAIPVTRLSEEGRRLSATVPAEAFRRSSLGGRVEPPRLPEATPGRLAFFNYDVNASLVSGDLSYTGAVRGGLRMDENALNVGGILTHNPNANGPIGWTSDLFATGSGSTRFVLTDLAYRRLWFDQRLTLTAGRGAMRPRGFLNGGLFDGVGLVGDNVDNQGNPRVSQSRMIIGYNPSPGVLTYRLGDAVLKQMPLAAGPYTIDPALFAGLPQGGVIEIAGYDGRTTRLAVPSGLIGRFQTMFTPGTSDFDVQAGRILTAGGGFAAALQLGGRKGISDSLTLEGGGSFTPHSAAIDVAGDLRLPHGLGVTGVTAAVQARRLNPDLPLAAQQKRGFSLATYYERRFGRALVGADWQRNRGGGILAGGYDGLRPDRASWSWWQGGNWTPGTGFGTGGGFPGIPIGSGRRTGLLFASTVRDDVRLYMNTPLFRSGVNVVASLRSSALADEPRSSRYAEVQAGGTLGRFGNWNLYGRGGRDGFGRSAFSAFLNWSMPLGHGMIAAVSLDTNRADGRLDENRAALTISGSDSTRWAQPDQWSVMADTKGYGMANYNREFATASTFASVTRTPGRGVAGMLGGRGSVAVADGRVILGKSTGDTMLVLKAPALPHEDVYYAGASTPSARTDGAGYAIVPHPLPFRRNQLRVADDGAPIGLDVPDQVMPDTVYPARGYIVPVATRMVMPARVFPTLPAGAAALSPFADVEGTAVPIEPDGSFYVEDLARVTRDVTVTWRLGDTAHACTVAIAPLKASKAPEGKLARRLEGVACTPAAPPPPRPARDAEPVAQAAPRLPYADLSGGGARDAAVTTAAMSAAPRPVAD